MVIFILRPVGVFTVLGTGDPILCDFRNTTRACRPLGLAYGISFVGVALLEEQARRLMPEIVKHDVRFDFSNTTTATPMKLIDNRYDLARYSAIEDVHVLPLLRLFSR